jgi:hypothetical protein
MQSHSGTSENDPAVVNRLAHDESGVKESWTVAVAVMMHGGHGGTRRTPRKIMRSTVFAADPDRVFVIAQRWRPD